MAIELSCVKGSIQEAARELDLNPGRISKCSQRHKKIERRLSATGGQQQIKRLQPALREAQTERDSLKNIQVTNYTPGDLVRFSETTRR